MSPEAGWITLTNLRARAGARAQARAFLRAAATRSWPAGTRCTGALKQPSRRQREGKVREGTAWRGGAAHRATPRRTVAADEDLAVLPGGPAAAAGSGQRAGGVLVSRGRGVRAQELWVRVPWRAPLCLERHAAVAVATRQDPPRHQLRGEGASAAAAGARAGRSLLRRLAWRRRGGQPPVPRCGDGGWRGWCGRRAALAGQQLKRDALRRGQAGGRTASGVHRKEKEPGARRKGPAHRVVVKREQLLRLRQQQQLRVLAAAPLGCRQPAPKRAWASRPLHQLHPLGSDSLVSHSPCCAHGCALRHHAAHVAGSSVCSCSHRASSASDASDVAVGAGAML